MVRKQRNFWDEYKYIIVAFLATTVTMLAVYLCNGMVPFGDKTILRMDLYHQYGPLFAELYDKVKNGGSLIYSWTSGLGSCFLGNYFNYLSSPLGAIVMFFGHKNITEAIATMILLKAALSASTFTFYLKRSLKSQSFAGISFGVLYAFCGYMLAYYWNVMWLDAMVLLPIVLVGIERIINNGKPATYITGLALTMFSNYYMSFMLCIFSVIYFFYYYINNYSASSIISKKYAQKNKGLFATLMNSRFFRGGLIFALSSLAAAGIMAFVLLPVYNILQSCSATADPFPSKLESYFTYFDFLANHIANLTTTIRSSGDDVLPNVYCGVLTIILAPLFFFTKSISKKEKISTLGLLVVLYFSFNLNYLNFIWHGMHFPNDLPYRQSFIYSFVLLVMAYKVFIRLNEFTSRQIGAVGAALVAFVFLIEEITSKNAGTGAILLTLALGVLYVLILTVFKDKKYDTVSLAILLLVCICSEVVMCDSSTVSITITKDSYASDYDKFTELKTSLDTIEQDEFYRMELANLRTRMDPSWYGYNGASVFSSMAYERLSNLQDDLGMMSNRINSYTYNPQTPIYNMMFSLKYIVNNKIVNVFNSPYYSASIKTDGFEAYKNNYYLPIAYCIDSAAESWATEEYMETWRYDYGSDPFELQGDYFNKASGAGNPFEKIDISYVTYTNVSPFAESLSGSSFNYNKSTPDTDASAVIYLTTEKKGNVYIYFDVSGASDKNVSVNSSVGTITQAANHNCILDLGYYNENETITINIPFENNSGNLKFFAYTLDDKILNKGYETLSNNQVIIEEFDDTYIKGKFTSMEDNLLYTSIPYDDGWSVIIDGKEVNKDDIIMFGNALLAVRTEEGNHTVEFRYTAPGLKEGVAVSAITLLILIGICIISSHRRKKRLRKLLPAYRPLDLDFSEEILLPAAVTDISVNKTTAEISPVSINRPRREVIMPPAAPTAKQVIAPPEIIRPATTKTDEKSE